MDRNPYPMPKINAQKICMIRTGALGDIVHALALVNGLRKGYPDAQITWVLQNLPYDMVKHQKNIDRFITFDRNADLKSWFELFGRLRKESFDLLIIPHVSAKASLLALFIRSGNKLGFDFKRSRELHWLVTNRRIPAAPVSHMQDQYFEFLDYLEIKDYPKESIFTFTDEERAWQRAFFDRFHRPVIGFVLASSNPEKDWAVANYAQVADYVDKVLNMQPLLIGGPSQMEKELAEDICRLCQKKPTLALEKPIRNTMLQIGGCRMIISPDTGPLHMAVAMNVPTIGLYGFTDPRRCGPYRKYHDLLIDMYNDPGQEDAPITRITRPGRMARITPEAVIEKIEHGLKAYPA
ncbi:MAG: lipopolysaccharide heptosyltransferase family protein [Desulfobacteraceae bacterium]|nr:MAG: lipopolysaccharide heptosyltransferase family protein [Desulfobacteraceae bacterium]